MLVSAVAEVDDRLIAEWDRSQNRTAAPLFEHGIGPSQYRSIKKPLVVQCLVARPPQGHRTKGISVVQPDIGSGEWEGVYIARDNKSTKQLPGVA